MAHLALLEGRDVEAARQRAAFLLRLAERREEGRAAPALLAAAHALAESASLLLAIDETDQAVRLLDAAVSRMLDMSPIAPSGLARLALLGAITGRIGTALEPDRIVVSEGPSRSDTFPWLVAQPDVAGALVAASLMSGQGGSLWSLVHSQLDDTSRPVWPWGAPDRAAGAPGIGAAAVLITMEYGVVPLFADRPPGWAADAAAGAVVRMFERSLMRLRLMLANPGRRALMALPGPVVDWPLLAVSIALRRIGFVQHLRAFQDDDSPPARALYQLFGFIEALVDEVGRGAPEPLAAGAPGR